jgi:hypothetical protein
MDKLAVVIDDDISGDLLSLLFCLVGEFRII